MKSHVLLLSYFITMNYKNLNSEIETSKRKSLDNIPVLL